MMNWLAERSDALNVLLSAAMLLVWLAYLQLFLQGLRRERRPRILISRGAGTGLGSRCILSNMSAEAIYVHSLVAELDRPADQTFAAVTDLSGGGEQDPRLGLREATLQGPVAAGDYIDVGTFASILDRAGWDKPDGSIGHAAPIEVELIVLATYRSEDLIVGASRRFGIEPGDRHWSIKPRTADTRQIRSRRRRRALHKAYLAYLN